MHIYENNQNSPNRKQQLIFIYICASTQRIKINYIKVHLQEANVIIYE